MSMKKCFLAISMLVAFTGIVRSEPITIHVEDAELQGDVSLVTQGGVSCAYMQQTGSIVFDAEIPETGPYRLELSVNTSQGNKSQDLYINDVFSSQLIFPENSQFFNHNAGVVSLQAGTNTIEIRASWGYMYFESITLTAAPPNDYSTTDDNLVNSSSDQKTKDLYSWLRSVYGTKIISGQTSYWDELVTIAERTPVVRAFDFQSYTVGYPYLWDNGIGGHTFGWHDDGTTQEAIDWYNSTDGEGIVTFQWHWHPPFDGEVSTNTFYTEHTTFDVSQAVTPGTDEYEAIITDIDSIASQLKRLEDAEIPVLWRPLHEAGGGWFWWGAGEASDALELWDIMYERLTNHHQINNLIWVWSTPEQEWYPGNDKVDIIGYDSYPGDYNYGTQKAIFNLLYDMTEGRKMIALTENGPIPDIDACIEEDAMWLYFCSWDDLVAQMNSEEHIKNVFAHSKVVTLENISDLSGIQFADSGERCIAAAKGLNVEVDGYSKGTVSLKVTLQKSRNVRVEIFDLNGKLVQTLISGFMEKGNHTVRFGTNTNAAGTYFLKLSTGGEGITRKLVIKK